MYLLLSRNIYLRFRNNAYPETIFFFLKIVHFTRVLFCWELFKYHSPNVTEMGKHHESNATLGRLHTEVTLATCFSTSEENRFEIAFFFVWTCFFSKVALHVARVASVCSLPYCSHCRPVMWGWVVFSSQSTVTWKLQCHEDSNRWSLLLLG